MVMEEAISTESGTGDVSVFSPVKAKQEEIYTLKFNYNNDLKKADLFNSRSRMDIIELATLIRDNDDLLTSEDDDKLMMTIGMMRHYHQEILKFSDYLGGYSGDRIQYQEIIRQNVTAFAAWAHEYNKKLNNIMKKNGEGSKTRKNADPITRLYLALNTPSKYNNMYGIPISPQMEVLARALHVRALNGWDNIVNITSNSETGGGKTTFGLALATTYAYHMTGLGWDWNYNLIINEDKEYVSQLFSHLEQFQIVQLDEAGNQGNKKTWWDSDQIDFMNYLTRLRVHGITTLVIWPDSKELDPGLASARAAINISINKRGIAIVKAFNRNPYAAKKDYIPYQAKNRVAISNDEAHDIVHEYGEMVNLLEIPFYKVPLDIWNANYLPRKEDSLKVSSLNKRYKKDRFETADDFYTKFLLAIPKDAIRVTAIEIKTFGEKEGYFISFRKIAERLAVGTNRRWKQIVKCNPGDEGKDTNEVGYIDLDPYIQQYLERLRSMKMGSQEGEAK